MKKYDLSIAFLLKNVHLYLFAFNENEWLAQLLEIPISKSDISGTELQQIDTSELRIFQQRP